MHPISDDVDPVRGENQDWRGTNFAMNEKPSPYRTIDFPEDRRDLPVINELNAHKHFMYALLEVDVTTVRTAIEVHRVETGELLSFTGYLAMCLARAVEEDKIVQAYMKGRKQLVVSDEVDVGLMVERRKGEKSILMGYVIRGANRKSYREIHEEIRAAQSDSVPDDGGMPSWFRMLLLLPWPLSAVSKALIQWTFRQDPASFTSMAGTVGITAVGMFGKGRGGWGVVPVIHNLALIVGGTIRKPAVVEGRIEPREMLDLTIAFDHDVIDGAPAARFAKRLVDLIQAGHGLEGLSGTPGCRAGPTTFRKT